MATSATDLITKFQRTYPDCSDTRAGELLQDALFYICSKIELRNVEVALTSLANGTREYDLNANVTQIHSVIYKETSASTTWKRLVGTNIDRLNLESPDWRQNTNESTPLEYYITSANSSDSAKNVIGFHPIPGTSSVNSYPQVAIYATQYAALTTSETMPSNILSDDVIIYYMCKKWAERTHRDMPTIEKWDMLFKTELAETEAHLRKMTHNEDPSFFEGPVHTMTRVV